MKPVVGKSLLFAFLLLPPVAFFLAFFRYTVDIPVNDDYKAVLNFINQFIGTASVKEQLALIFSQHNEHRIVYDRLLIILCYKLNGLVNFNYLALVGNLSLVGIFWIFAKKLRQINTNLLYLLPLSVLLFNISFWENMTFAMAAASNLTVFLFSLGSIYFLTKTALSRTDFIASVLLFLLAVFTQGGGMMLIPIAIAILLYRKEKKFLIVFAVVALLVAAFYFHAYQKPDEATTLSDTLANFKVRSLLFAFAVLGNAFDYYLIFTNDLNESIGITSIIGFVFLCAYLYALKTKYYQKNLFAFAVMTLIVITAFVTGISRSHMGLETAGASRYRITGVVFLIALYFWILETNKKTKNLKITIGAASLLYFLFISLNQYEYLSYREYKSQMGVLRYKSGEHQFLNGFEQDYYKNTLINAAQKETYFLPSDQALESFFPFSKKTDTNTNAIASQITSSVDNIAKIKDSFIVEGYAFDQQATTSGQKIMIGLKAADGSLRFFSTKPMPRFDLNPYFKRFDLRDTGFFGRIRLNDITPGNYKIVIKLVSKNNEIRITETDKFLNY